MSVRRTTVSTARRRLAAGVISGFVALGSLVAAGAPAQAASSDDARGTQSICVHGTHGRYARLAILDADRQLVTVFHLRKGCRTLRLGRDLPAGGYIVKHRAPRGMLTGGIGYSAWGGNPDGSAIGAVARPDPHPTLKKVKSFRFSLDPYSSGSVSFDSVRNPRR